MEGAPQPVAGRGAQLVVAQSLGAAPGAVVFDSLHFPHTPTRDFPKYYARV